jgi:hypothetical protein
MKIENPGSLKNCGCIGIVATALLIMSLLVAGCTQSSPDNSGQATALPTPSGDSGTSSPSQGAGSAGPAGTVPDGSGVSPAGTTSGAPHTGGNFLTNETRLAAAAQTLGVSEDDLKSALTPPAQGRVNFTTAASQLGVTTDQLTSALGIPAGGFGNGTRQRGGYNASYCRTPPGP